jgi:hypothetical protein
MPDIVIEQALYGNPEAGGFRFLARSAGFLDTWSAEAERICAGFGERPAGIACPAAVFAVRFLTKWVAVVQVADQGTDAEGRPGAIAFRLMVLSRRDYAARIGDPFAIADHFPPPWEVRGTLPTLAWADEFLPLRRLADVAAILKQPMSPTYLGGAQALVEDRQVVFERPAPAPELVRNLWALLPYSNRGELWPCSFAFGNALRFDIAVVPRAQPADFSGYVTEENAGDYPEGDYEAGIQAAAQSGDEAELFAMFRRRSSRQTLRLAVSILVFMALVVGVMRVLTGVVPGPSPMPSSVGPTVPLDDRYPALSDAEHQRLTEALRSLAGQLKVEASPNATAEDLLDAIDRRLPVREPGRDIGPIRAQGDTERQVRCLLWKQHVAGGGDPKLNVVELVERLQRQLANEGPKP